MPPSQLARDRALCAALLPRVSRTFALSIEALPEALSTPVTTAYLLCRIADTIEDDPALLPTARDALFVSFGAGLDGRIAPELLAADWASLTADGADGALMKNAESVFRVYRSLPAEERALMHPPLETLARGMRSYCSRPPEEGSRIRDLQDLETYCYFVAGTVGELLTALFERHVPGLELARRVELERRAVSFGLGLQLVNILKDLALDIEEGRLHLPETLLTRKRLAAEDVLEPRHRGRALEVVRELSARALQHLDHAREYTLLWPLPGGREVRLFCAVPLALAYATLSEVARGADVLIPGRAPKVGRDVVATVVAAVQARAGAPELSVLLESWAERARRAVAAA